MEDYGLQVSSLNNVKSLNTCNKVLKLGGFYVTLQKM